MVETAVAAGGRHAMEAQDHGRMYGWSFYDLDGHHWEVFARLPESARSVLVNGATGMVSLLPGGRPLAIMGFTIRRGKIAEIDILADPARLGGLDLTVLDA
jgi:hypothetical protein